MAEILKSVNVGASLATTVPSHNCMIGPDLTAGERLFGMDACYIAPNGLVLRSIAAQATGAAAVNDVQLLNINGSPTDGSYALAYPPPNQSSISQYSSQATPPLAYNSTASQIQTALQALSTVGAGNVIVTGTYPNFTITAAGGFAGQELDTFYADASLLLLNNQNAGAPDSPLNVQIIHSVVGQPAGTSAANQQSVVRGYAPIPVRTGQPVTLYHSIIAGYSDQLLVPGSTLYLSGTVPGGLTDTQVYAGQKPAAFAIDNTRVYLFSVS